MAKTSDDKSVSIIGFCGIDCGQCKAFIATRNDDAELRRAAAAEWSKFYGHELKPEDINCVGCTAPNGSHIGYCAVCEIRTCGTNKKVQNCGYCVEYGCSKLKKVHDRSAEAKGNLDKIHAQLKKK